MKNYEVLIGDKGQKQVRYWPAIMPISVADFKWIISKEFTGIDESQLRFEAGIVNFLIEIKQQSNNSAGQVS